MWIQEREIKPLQEMHDKSLQIIWGIAQIDTKKHEGNKNVQHIGHPFTLQFDKDKSNVVS